MNLWPKPEITLAVFTDVLTLPNAINTILSFAPFPLKKKSGGEVLLKFVCF